MKVAATIAAIVGTLAVLTPLSVASEPVAQRDNVAINDVDLEARGTSSCGVSSRKHHHRKGKKKSKAKHVNTKVKSPNVGSNNKKSAARPSHFYYVTSSRDPQASATKAATSTTSRVVASTTSSSAPASTTTASAGSGTTLSSFEQTMLDMHNTDRAQHSAPALTWDSTVAQAAASWAAGCKFQHTPNNPYGQNIAAGTWAAFGASDAATMWYDEYKLYDYNNPAYSSATGHFTQMIWKDSKRLGCAIQTCTASQMGLGSSGTARFVVCDYDPPGNYLGQFEENVLPN